MTSFRELHQPGKPFILSNAWDKGSAQILAALGAQAIATSSAAHAFTLGRPDMGKTDLAMIQTHVRKPFGSPRRSVSQEFASKTLSFLTPKPMILIWQWNA